jgi:hypothetical protein
MIGAWFLRFSKSFFLFRTLFSKLDSQPSGPFSLGPGFPDLLLSLCPACPASKPFLPQTRRDFESKAMELQESGLDAEAGAEEARVQNRCAAWVCGEPIIEQPAKRRRGNQAESITTPKVHRQKSYRFLLELDNSLLGPCRQGPGLQHFQLPADWLQHPDPLSWPCLILSSDQGSDAWAAQNWMDSPLARVNYVREPDSHNHGVHNDTLGAAMEVGLGPFLYAMVVVLNLMFLPWNDGRFGGMVQSAVKEMGQLSGPDDVLFKRYFSRIAHEKGFHDRLLGGEDVEQEVWNAFLDSEGLRKRFQKVGMCRWYQLFVRLRTFMEDWTSLLVVLVRLCIDDKFLTHLSMEQLMEPVKQDMAMPGASGERVQTKSSSADEIRTLRKACRNAMHLAIFILSDPMNQARAQVLKIMTIHTHAWYHEQAKVLRNATAAGGWHVAQLHGAFWVPLRNTFALLQDPRIVEALGMSVSFGAAAVDVPSMHAELAGEQGIAALAGTFVQSLVKKRVFRSAWMLYGWPSRCAEFLNSDPQVVAAAVQDLKEDYEVYMKAENMSTEFFAAFVSRSPFKLPSVMQIVLPLKANDWTLTKPIVDLVKARNQGFKQSRVVEDGFLVERRQETSASNAELVENQIFMSLIEKKLLKEKFAFETHPDSLPHHRATDMPKDAFRAVASSASMDCRSIRSTKAKPDWYSPAPSSWPRKFTDAGFLRHLEEKGDWAKANKLWLTCLLPQKDTVLIRPLGGDKPWSLVLGHCESAAALLWPVEAAGGGHQDCYT